MAADEWYSPKVFAPTNLPVILNHSRDEHVRGAFHNQELEGFWGLLKWGIIGIYHQVSYKHLQRYCDGFTRRYNSRDLKDFERFEHYIGKSNGRLKYKNLIEGPKLNSKKPH